MAEKVERKERKPELRFKGFDGEWEEEKFSSVFSYLQNNTLSRAELTSDTGFAKNIHYGDILTKFEEVLDVENIDLPFTSNKDVVAKFSSSFLRDKDVVIADTAEDETVGKCCELKGVRDDIVLSGLHTIPCRPNQTFSSEYLGYYLNSPAYHSQLLPLMQGTKVTSISKNALGDTEILYPATSDEQGKISCVFSSLTLLITNQQHKYDQLQNLKKAMLEKMFPRDGADVPEIRFKGFEKPWKRVMLPEFVKFYGGLTYNPDNVCSDGTLVLRSSNVKYGEIVDADNVYVSPDIVNSDNVQKGDIVVVVRNGSRALIGKHAIIREDMPNTVIGAFMTGIRCDHPSFTSALLETSHFEKEVEKNMGATINQITGYMFSRMEFNIPQSQEQIEIGKYFTHIDSIISYQQKKIEHLKHLKSALLEKMFVSEAAA